MKIPAFVWIILFIVIGFGVLLLLNNAKPKADLSGRTLPVEVEVYMDFNCPHCATFEPYVGDLRTTYGEKVNVVQKHLPILTTGQASDTSFDYAVAAEAARAQGKFDEYSQGLFKWITFRKGVANSPYTYSEDENTFFSSGNVDTQRLAERLGLDMSKFNEDVAGEEMGEIVLSQKRSAVERMGPASTPAVFIYGEYFQLETLDDVKTRVGEIIAEIEAKQ